MKIVIAIDSFKGSLSSIEAANAVSDGIKKVITDATICIYPLADGGEGTIEALTNSLGGKLEKVKVSDPLNNDVIASYGFVKKSKTAIMEIAQSSGITLIKPENRNPLFTSTFGVGEMIRDAITKGIRNFIIGIGGSATNDGGVGMLQALGFEFNDINGNAISRGCIGLDQLTSISTINVIPELKECSFKIACDVTNPLCGPNGASYVYGPQKGADNVMVKTMDSLLKKYSSIAEKILNKPNYSKEAGAGAAGGLGFAFKTFLNGTLEPGVSLILSQINIEKDLKEADLVITGEGKLDGQTVFGKAPIGVAKMAKKYGKKVIALCGCIEDDAEKCNDEGIDAFFSCLRKVCSIDEALNKNNAYKNLVETSEQLFNLINLCL